MIKPIKPKLEIKENKRLGIFTDVRSMMCYVGSTELNTDWSFLLLLVDYASNRYVAISGNSVSAQNP